MDKYGCEKRRKSKLEAICRLLGQIGFPCKPQKLPMEYLSPETALDCAFSERIKLVKGKMSLDTEMKHSQW